MKNVKKISLIILVVIIVLFAIVAFCACDNNINSSQIKPSSDISTQQEQERQKEKERKQEQERQQEEPSKKSYVITYVLNGGVNNEYNPSTYTIESQKITLETPTKTGYTFEGWYSNHGLTTKETIIPEGSRGDKTFYAKWTPTAYTISYTLDGGSVSGTNPTSYTIESDEITLINPSRIGCVFLGWSGTDIKDKSTSVTINKGSYGDRSYTANWQAVEEMSNFVYSSISTNCTITGIKDKTVKSIVVPDYVTSIGEGAFYGCSNLESITLPFVGGSKTATSSSALFGYIFGTSSYTGGTATKQYYRDSSSSYTTYYIPSTLKSVTITGGKILYGAFYGCSGLTSVTIGNSVTSIGNDAFWECSGLTSVTIGNSVTSIGNHAFAWCSGLTSITIPDSVTSIGAVAFYECSGLTSVTIGNSVTSIGNEAFYECSGLTSVTIGNSVTSIGDGAFKDCSGLTSITIPNSVTSIGDYAFKHCDGLTSITYKGTIAQWNAISKGNDWKYSVVSPSRIVHCTDGDKNI